MLVFWRALWPQKLLPDGAVWSGGESRGEGGWAALAAEADVSRTARVHRETAMQSYTHLWELGANSKS